VKGDRIVTGRALKTLTGEETVLPPDALAEFEARLGGTLIRPEDAAYDEARALWNGMIDKRPGLIVRCAGTADVLASVRLAREHKLLTAVRSGGHNVAGNAMVDGGLVIDLSRMRGIWVDPKKRVARVQGGVTLGDIDRETQPFGLAASMGVVTATGIAGLTLGGGYGWLTRKHGLACDNLLSVDLVTADGQLRTASTIENPDLYWAVRGGGGNFGVAVSFEFRLHPVGPEAWLAAAFYPATKAREGLRYFREAMATAPEDLFALAVLWSAPEADPFPQEMWGQPVLAFVGVYTGPLAQGEAVIRPLREFGTPIADLSGQMPYIDIQQFYDEDYPDGMLYYWKSIYLDKLSDAALDALAEHGVDRPSPLSNVDVWYLGGAFSRVGAQETAVGRRDFQAMIGVEANWTDPDQSEANIRWARNLVAQLKPYSSGGSYLNFGGYSEEGQAVVENVYEQNLQRLAAIKKKYDPDNLFRVNHNIKPAG
jgi:FAD/FMN-containing dehydrogenase